MAKTYKTTKKGLTSPQLMALFVVGVMAFSTIAFSLLSGGSAHPKGAAPPPNDSQDSGTPLSFSAQVKATVVDLLPSFKLFAVSNEVNIDALDSLVRQVPGVTRLTSVFKQDASRPGLLYSADVEYAKDQVSLQDIIAGITANTKGKLSKIGVFSFALLEVPHKVEFKNQDLNLTKEHIFLDQLIQGLVLSTTQKGDLIQAGLDVTFTGVALTNQNAYELKNFSAQPVERAATRPLKAATLEPLLFFEADTNFSETLLPTALEQDLAGIPDLNSTKFLVTPTGFLELEINADLNAQKFSVFLDSLSEVQQHQLVSKQPFDFLLKLENAEAHSVVVTAIQDELTSQGVFPEQIVFKPFPISVQAHLSVTKNGLANIESIASQVQDALASKLPTITLYQIGTVQADSIKESITNPASQEFFIEGGMFSVFFFPGTQVGETVLVALQYKTIRNQVASINAMQIEEPKI